MALFCELIALLIRIIFKILGCWGFPYSEMKQFLGFLVFDFWLLVVWFSDFLLYGFVFVWFYGFLVSNMYQISTSCFQEDIDLISMIFKMLLDLQDCSVPTFSNIVKVVDIHFWYFLKISGFECFGFLHDVFRYPCV